jgi:hypothetical protein
VEEEGREAALAILIFERSGCSLYPSDSSGQVREAPKTKVKEGKKVGGDSPLRPNFCSSVFGSRPFMGKTGGEEAR